MTTASLSAIAPLSAAASAPLGASPFAAGHALAFVPDNATPLAIHQDWSVLKPLFISAIGQTLVMVFVTLLIGGLLGLVLGVILWGTRPGGLFANRVVYRILDVIINIIRPIPFIIFLAAMQPLTTLVIGTSIGTTAAIFPMIIMCTMATARLVEQNLVTTDPGIIEAARSMGVPRLQIITTVLIPESLAPLILAYAFLFISVLDMSAMAGYIGGGGLGNFAISYGYQKFDQTATWAAVIVMIVLVQVVQYLANAIASRLLHRR